MSKRMAKVASAFSILWFGFFLISCILLFFFVHRPLGQGWPGFMQWASCKPNGISLFSFELS